MEIRKTEVAVITDAQRTKLQELEKLADGLHSRIGSEMGFKNMMKSDIIAVAWNARVMLNAEDGEPKKLHDEEYAKRLDMWVHLSGGDAESIDRRIEVMGSVLTFWEAQAEKAAKMPPALE